MVEKLKIKEVYDDFLKSVKLTDEQIKILNMLINKDSLVKIAMEVGVSQRTIGYEVKKIKNLYQDYVFMQTWKAMLLL